MKRYHVVLFSVLSLIVVLALSACGKNESGSSAKPTSEPASKATTGSTSPSKGGDTPKAELPKTVTIATHAVGGAYHAVGSGLAKLLTEKTPMRTIVQPTAGPNAWMNDLNAGNINFGLLQAMDAGWAYSGGPGFDKPAKNLRMVLAGNIVYNTGFAVRKDSGINSLKELKGKRVASDYGGNFSLGMLAKAELDSVGLTWNDVKQVPVPENSAGLKLLQNGSVEATMAASPNTPNTMETNAAVELKILPFADLKPADIKNGIPANIQAILDKNVPGVSLGVAPKGLGILKEDTVMYAYPIFMAASEKTSPDAVYTVLKTIWENHKEIASVHPWLKAWDSKKMLSSNPPAPYHEGAVKFFKEAGVWTNEHQKIQDQLLAKK